MISPTAGPISVYIPEVLFLFTESPITNLEVAGMVSRGM